jgi:hypothetical protein
MAPKAPAPKKRKLANSNDGSSSRPVKKSPLAGLPQNYYAPPKPTMTREELAAWRKEQRRERNRQSAADSRNKTKARIEQLEGELTQYKSLCQAMQSKMEAMERQIAMLTASAEQKVGERCSSFNASPEQITPPTSHPNSPSGSITHQDTLQLPLFPPLLSSPTEECTPLPVPSQDMEAAAAVASLKTLYVPSSSSFESQEHLTISRQA